MEFEEVTKALIPVAKQFLSEMTTKKIVYLYPEELHDVDLFPLADGRVVEVSFRITSDPLPPYMIEKVKEARGLTNAK